MQKIIPFLWFNDQAEEAANFYTSLFKNSKILNTTHYDKESSKVSGKPEGSVLTITIELEGQQFGLLNGGPEFKFTEATSFLINCKDQEEIDHFWNKLTEGGEEGPCGWLKDKFGVSWQVAPTVLDEMLQDKDPEKAQRAMKAMLQMRKIVIEDLEKAYKGNNNMKS